MDNFCYELPEASTVALKPHRKLIIFRRRGCPLYYRGVLFCSWFTEGISPLTQQNFWLFCWSFRLWFLALASRLCHFNNYSWHLVISDFIFSPQLTLYSYPLHLISSGLIIPYRVRPFQHASLIANYNLFVGLYLLVGKAARCRVRQMLDLD